MKNWEKQTKCHGVRIVRKLIGPHTHDKVYIIASVLGVAILDRKCIFINIRVQEVRTGMEFFPQEVRLKGSMASIQRSVDTKEPTIEWVSISAASH